MGRDAGCFTVEFLAPSGSSFSVAAEDCDRITVRFDFHHVHFSGWAESVDARDFESAVEHIRRLISGEYRLAGWSSDGKFAESLTFARGETPQSLPSSEELIVAVEGWNPQDSS